MQRIPNINDAIGKKVFKTALINTAWNKFKTVTSSVVTSMIKIKNIINITCSKILNNFKQIIMIYRFRTNKYTTGSNITATDEHAHVLIAFLLATGLDKIMLFRLLGLFKSILRSK